LATLLVGCDLSVELRLGGELVLSSEALPQLILVLDRLHHVGELLALLELVKPHLLQLESYSLLGILEGLGLLVILEDAVRVLSGLEIVLHGELLAIVCLIKILSDALQIMILLGRYEERLIELLNEGE
jgi:hypothetical protein